MAGFFLNDREIVEQVIENLLERLGSAKMSRFWAAGLITGGVLASLIVRVGFIVGVRQVVNRRR